MHFLCLEGGFVSPQWAQKTVCAALWIFWSNKSAPENK